MGKLARWPPIRFGSTPLEPTRFMFLDRVDEARALYLKYRGQQKVSDDKSWGAVILGDFAEFQKAGLISSSPRIGPCRCRHGRTYDGQSAGSCHSTTKERTARAAANCASPRALQYFAPHLSECEWAEGHNRGTCAHRAPPRSRRRETSVVQRRPASVGASC